MKTHEDMFSWFQVPDDIKKLLIMAAENWEDTSASQHYINLALAKTKENVEVLVAAYRYFFYKNNYKMALQTAVQVRDIIKESENLPDDWQQLKAILLNRKQEPKIRMLLTAYAASGLVLAKLGEIETAKEISSQVKEIDDKNEFGAALLLDILTREEEL